MWEGNIKAIKKKKSFPQFNRTDKPRLINDTCVFFFRVFITDGIGQE